MPVVPAWPLVGVWSPPSNLRCDHSRARAARHRDSGNLVSGVGALAVYSYMYVEV